MAAGFLFPLEVGLMIGLIGSLGGVSLSLLLRSAINRAVEILSTRQNLPAIISINLSLLTSPVIVTPELALFAVALTIAVSVERFISSIMRCMVCAHYYTQTRMNLWFAPSFPLGLLGLRVNNVYLAC